MSLPLFWIGNTLAVVILLLTPKVYRSAIHTGSLEPLRVGTRLRGALARVLLFSCFLIGTIVTQHFEFTAFSFTLIIIALAEWIGVHVSQRKAKTSEA